MPAILAARAGSLPLLGAADL